MQQNSLLEPFYFPPFSEIKETDFLPAIEKAIEWAQAEIEKITDSTEEPSFQNTIEALEYSGLPLGNISSVLFNLHSAETSDTLEEVAMQVSPLLSNHGNDVLLNQKLFERIQLLWNRRELLRLNQVESRLLEKTWKAFSRNGALLNETQKEELRKIDTELSMEALAFGKAVLDATNSFFLELTQEEMSGLPDSAKEAAVAEAKERGLQCDGVITLQHPSYIPAMTYLEDRKIRETLYRAFSSRALVQEDNNINRVYRLSELKRNRAKLLGFKSHAHFTLAERMAKTQERVNTFLEELLLYAKPAALNEIEELKRRALADGCDELKKWDVAYYSEKWKQEAFSLDSEALKPYFPLGNVLDGAFQIAHKLYGLSFLEKNTIDTYHPDVTTYEVVNKEGKILSWLYLDFFPRKGKRAGAWMTSFSSQMHLNGKEMRPLVSVVCNFTPPQKNKPSLLTFNEVTTLFHELGHALHGMLAEGKYPSLTGTSVYWDFVELPSQLFENWCYESEALALFAKHYKTAEVLPSSEIEKIKAASNHMQGTQTLRQLGFGLLDMLWHGENEPEKPLQNLEKSILSRLDFLEAVENTSISCSFSHIFQGGYSAGYYSYKWAEVLEADAFEYFKEKGIFNNEVADKFYVLLSSGGQKDPNELYEEFRGREADPRALLRRAGLIKHS